jgi:hypothetical protein
MKTIYDHDRLIMRVAASDAGARVFFEKSSERSCTERLGRSAPSFPTLQGPHAHRQPCINENVDCLRLAESVGLTPAYKLLNHGRQIFRNFLSLIARSLTPNVLMLLKESRQRRSGDGVRRPMANLPVLQSAQFHGQPRVCKDMYYL